MANSQCNQTHSKKIVLPYVAPLADGDEIRLHSMEYLLRRERLLMLEIFRESLDAAGIEYTEAPSRLVFVQGSATSTFNLAQTGGSK
jgi:hypothetical protein